MSKLSQLDKAIAALEAEKAVIDRAIAKLREQQATKPAHRPKKAGRLERLAAEAAKPMIERTFS